MSDQKIPPPMKDPYRESADPAPVAPQPTTLEAFALHERALAIISIYKQTIGKCTTPKDLDKVKALANTNMDERFPDKTKGELALMKDRCTVAVYWLHTLTLDDCQLFRDPKGKKTDPVTIALVVSVVVMIGVVFGMLGVALSHLTN